PIASPQSSTTYTFRAYNGICASLPVDVRVVVHSVPSVTLNPGITICSTGASVLLSAQGTGGSRPFTMAWSPAWGLGNPLSLTTHAFPASTTMYYYTVSSGTGATMCMDRDSILVTVVPGVRAGLRGDTTIICPGTPVLLEAWGRVGNATYQ